MGTHHAILESTSLSAEDGWVVRSNEWHVWIDYKYSCVGIMIDRYAIIAPLVVVRRLGRSRGLGRARRLRRLGRLGLRPEAVDDALIRRLLLQVL